MGRIISCIKIRIALYPLVAVRCVSWTGDGRCVLRPVRPFYTCAHCTHRNLWYRVYNCAQRLVCVNANAHERLCVPFSSLITLRGERERECYNYKHTHNRTYWRNRMAEHKIQQKNGIYFFSIPCVSLWRKNASIFAVQRQKHRALAYRLNTFNIQLNVRAAASSSNNTRCKNSL